ncbi:hypothetical protein B0H16DRAFT_1459027 [Mycena metata]|uniref:Uncharacterized protein n=1 Tax=Mycena metata TaxID=1033252 RepID=A0AAD7J238_9AGAR|nr:hypothetical protein B0H16DRAFT_1459027 [Mycena metata]
MSPHTVRPPTARRTGIPGSAPRDSQKTLANKSTVFGGPSTGCRKQKYFRFTESKLCRVLGNKSLNRKERQRCWPFVSRRFSDRQRSKCSANTRVLSQRNAVFPNRGGRKRMYRNLGGSWIMHCVLSTYIIGPRQLHVILKHTIRFGESIANDKHIGVKGSVGGVVEGDTGKRTGSGTLGGPGSPSLSAKLLIAIPWPCERPELRC